VRCWKRHEQRFRAAAGCRVRKPARRQVSPLAIACAILCCNAGMNRSDERVGARHGSPSRVSYAAHRRAPRETTTAWQSAQARAPTRECYIVIGNHASYVGIGEILYTLNAYFSERFRTHVSQLPIPNEINVIIDEFSTRARVEYFIRMKKNHPKTQFILMATEFATELSWLGICFGNTFNFFGSRKDYRQLLSLLAYRLHLRIRPPYLFARYCGFVQALTVADLLICAHPDVARSMRLLPADIMKPHGPPLTLYPEIDCNRLADDQRLYRLPAGVVMTGTLTSFRKRIASRMILTFQKAAVHVPFYQYVPFDQSTSLRFDGHEVDLGYDEIADPNLVSRSAHEAAKNYLYNLNPPQWPKWPYSSPMRILRAILLGQIPVVTRKFGDHDIESVALVWDDKVETAERMWVDATMGRAELVERHLAAVIDYNRVAQKKNAAVDGALIELG
jgi:hypothetical protein